MAIPATNAAYRTQGPSVSGQVLASSNLSDTEVALVATTTITLDGTATAAVVNFIDGTQTLSFVPSAIIAQISGGTSALVPAITISAISATSFTVNFSAAGTNANTVKLAFIVLK